MTGRCVDCDAPVSKASVARCRHCNGRLMSRRHRVKRGQRAARLAVQARASRRWERKLLTEKERVYGA